MSERNNKAVRTWLLAVCGLILVMVVLGGIVRLTRSGLSIVEWNPVSGIIPPIGEEAWQVEFAKYQATPEFQKINRAMTLTEYKEIFYLEYVHRLIARFAGLIVALPLLYFLWKGILPWRKSAVYVAIGLLFGFQGYLGWVMVSSGLVDRPSVSHYWLTFHLLTALFLLGLAVWMALNHTYRFPRLKRPAIRSRSFALSGLLMLVLVIQITYGGFMAGLKAGHISNTYPLMFGQWIPQGLLSQVEPWWENLVSVGTTVHFVHRWFALVVLAAAGALYFTGRNQGASSALNKGIAAMVVLTAVQIALGVSVIWFNVPTVLASAHQAVALFLFITAVFINYQVLYEPAPEPPVHEAEMVVRAA